MSDFRKVAENFWVSPQIGIDDVAEARERGFGAIVNNRPDGEAEDQVAGAQIAAAASAAGLDYVAIPVTTSAIGADQVRAMAAALESARGPILAYCRSGTRSTFMWALARALAGDNVDTIAARAAAAGYDVGPIRPLLESMNPSG